MGNLPPQKQIVQGWIGWEAIIAAEANGSLGKRAVKQNGYGSKLNHQGTADVSPCFYLPGLILDTFF